MSWRRCLFRQHHNRLVMNAYSTSPRRSDSAALPVGAARAAGPLFPTIVVFGRGLTITSHILFFFRLSVVSQTLRLSFNPTRLFGLVNSLGGSSSQSTTNYFRSSGPGVTLMPQEHSDTQLRISGT